MQLPRVFARRPRWVALRIPYFYAVVVLGYSSALWLADISVLLALPGVILAGLAVHGLGTQVHEASHGGLADSLRTNRWLGVCAGLAACIPYSLFRASHLAHHGTTGSTDDPTIDNPDRLPDTFWNYVGQLVVGCLFFIPLMQIELLRTFPQTRPRRRQIIDAAIDGALCGLIWFVLLTASFMTDNWRLIAIYWAVIVVGSADAWIVTLAEHSGLGEQADPALATRTTYSPAWHRHFISNRNYHTAHHLYPRVSSAHLPALTRLLKSEGRVPIEERSYTAAHWNMLRRLWRARTS